MTPISATAKRQIISLLQSNQAFKAKELCMTFGDVPADPEILVLSAYAYLRLGEIDAALAAVRSAMERGRNDVNVMVVHAALLIHDADHVKAAASFKKLLKSLPSASEAHRLVANVLSQMGDYGRSVEHYRSALELDSNNLSALTEYASLQQGAQQYDDSTKLYEHALNLKPDHPSILLGLAMSRAGLKQFDQAAESLERVVKIEPANTVALFNLGETYQNLNRFHEAIGSYRRALMHAPNAAALHGSMGRAYRNLGDLQSALQCFRRAQTLEPNNATVHHQLGICQYDDTNLGPAMRSFSESVRLEPGNALTHFYLGLVCAQNGDAEKAKARFAEACRLWPYLESFVDSYHYAMKMAPNARYFSTSRKAFEYAVANASNTGLFLEFGVYHGASINIIAQLTSNTVHGFDTFQGLPFDWVLDRGHKKSIEPAGSYSTHGRVPRAPGNVKFHVGTFDETLPNFCQRYGESVSFMNVDCDLYESTRSVFEHIGRQIGPGTVIVFDEYFCLPGWRDHEYKAFQEFINGAGLSYEYLAFNFFTGQVVVRIESA